MLGGSLVWHLRIWAYRFIFRRTSFKTHSRLWFEFELLRYVAQQRPQKVLFVGVDEYTAWYHRLFPANVFESLDIDPLKARFGSPSHHIVGDCSKVLVDGRRGPYDTVILNGVYGWGLDEGDQLFGCLNGIAAILAPKGMLVFGFNEDRDPLYLLHNKAKYFSDFEQVSLNGIWTITFETYMHHTFMFFRVCSDSR